MLRNSTFSVFSVAFFIGCGGETPSTPSGWGGATGVGGVTITGGRLPTSGGATSSSGGASSGGVVATPSGGVVTTPSGGVVTTPSGGVVTTASGGQIAVSGGSGGARTGTGGTTGGSSMSTGGKTAGGAATGGATSMGTGGTGGAVVIPPPPPLDCGKEGWALENHGSPKNRVNYVILGDGYTTATVETTLVEHINKAMERRFGHESGEPLGRYRKFVNICVMKAISQTDGIGKGATAFDGGNGGDRLARVNSTKVNDYLNQNLPKSFETDWKAVVLNQSLWENTGGALMLWSGANGDAAGAALHEGGHGHHQLADEYGASTGCPKSGTGATSACSGSGTVYAEVNSAGNCTTTDNKWDLWLGTTQKGLKVPDMGATGVQGTFPGSRYVGSGQYRPSCNSMMNSLFGLNLNTSFNSVSRENIIFTIWRAVTPIDSTEPPAGAVTNPATLKVNVVDPAVINVDWTVDGMTTVNGGITFDASKLAAGSHTITAKAYDNATTDLVKYRDSTCPSSVTGNYCSRTAWKRSEQTVSWTVTKN